VNDSNARTSNARTISLGATAHVRSADEALHWALDLEGRLLAGHEDGLHHRVGLDASVLSRTPGAVPRRTSPEEGDRVLARAAASLREAAALLARGEATLELADGQDPERARHVALGLLERAAARADRPDDERAAFARVYRPVRMLPPDSTNALVLQVTEGCSWGRCTFCSLYEGVPFRVKDERALLEHVDGVEALLGAGAAQRTRVFLGDANALLAPMPRLLQALALARARFPAATRDGAGAFVDAFSGRGRTEDELRALRDAGLRRLTVGLESGSLALLRSLRKPSTPDAVAELVRVAHRAGLAVAVTVLAGAGGRTFEREHEVETARVVRALDLGPSDLVFLSPLVGSGGGGVEPLEPAEVSAQARRLNEALGGGPWRVVPYDLRRSIF
jgi:radical SAM superfamily enzyme YgiQ (UPF0313 family)